MSKNGRDSLKDLFKAGKLPRQQDFEALIESMLHMDDEGFRKSDSHGLHITSAVTCPGLVTFFRKEQQQTPMWHISHAALGHQLRLSRAEDDAGRQPPPALLTLDSAQRVGVAQENPQHTLHVGGVVASRARVGTVARPVGSTPMLANREWHVLVGGLQHCQAFEVTACISHEGEKRGAVLHAVAVSAGRLPAQLPWWLSWLDPWVNRRNRIRAVDAWYGERCDRLELQWQAGREPDTYQLAVRSACKYGGSQQIQAHVTELWPARGEASAAADAPGHAPGRAP